MKDLVRAYGKQWKFIKEIKIILQYNPGITCLGIFPKELKLSSQRNIYTLMFSSA